MIKWVVQTIGSVVFAILIYSIPVLATCALIYSWAEPIIACLMVVAFIQFVVLGVIVYNQCTEE